MHDVEGASLVEIFDGSRELEGDLHATLPREGRPLIAAAAVEVLVECAAGDIFAYKCTLIFMRQEENIN